MTQARILIVTTGYPRFRGDTFGVFVQDLAEGLAESGVEVGVLAPHEAKLPFVNCEGGVKVFRLPYFPFFASLAYGSGIPSNMKNKFCLFQLPFFVFFMSFWTMLLAFKYQVIHAQWSMSGFFALLTKWLHRKPIVVTFRGSDLHSKGLLRKVSTLVTRYSEANLCVSAAQCDSLRPQASVLCPNLVDTTRFKPLGTSEKAALKKSMGFESGERVIVFVGYLIQIKRVDLLIQAMSEVDATLLIIGDGLLKSELEKRVHELGLVHKIKLLGHISYHEVHPYYQSADLHVLASENEGRPNVLYQAMACGIPSVSTAVGGVPEMLDHEKSGLLVEPESKSFSQAINQLLNDETMRQECGRRAFEKLKVLEVDKLTVIEKHKAIYSSFF